MRQTISHHSATTLQAATFASFASVQFCFQFKCCGANGPQDYSGSNWETNGGVTHKNQVPKSCCKEGSIICTGPFIIFSSPDVYNKVRTAFVTLVHLST